MLLLLDNARDADQVRPLLPGSPGCLVIVTSRSQLISLVAAEGAYPVTLDVLTEAEARELLTQRLGPHRAASDPAAAGELIRLCDHLPLALSIAAARAASQPEFPLAALAADLRDASGRLDALDPGDTAASVRAVFSWSYHQLDARSARVFRLLGLHPGTAIGAAAAASMAGLPPREARARAGRADQGPAAGRRRARPVSPSTTCSARTPPSRPRRRTPRPSGARRSAGCSITTCTPPAPPP